MSITRRNMISLSAGALAAAMFESNSAAAEPHRFLNLHQRFRDHLPIEKIEALRRGDQFYVRVRAGGNEGIIAANSKLPDFLSLLTELIVPFFLKKDARDLEALIDDVYTDGRNYKYAGMPFWNAVAHVELAIFDLLSRVADVPVGQLLGKVIRTEIPVYISRFDRDSTPEQEVRVVSRALAATGATATKLKIGRRMFNTAAQTKRDLAMLELARQTWGDDVHIFVDANGSYTAQEAIAIGWQMEKLNVGFFEEPCRWQNYQGTLEVADALDMTVAGGEQDSSLDQFAWMIERRVVDLVQPDMYYNGGLIRMLRVAALAAAAGRKITPHSPKTGAEAAANLHFASVVPNLGPFQEYREASEVKAGKVKVPTGVGLGVDYDAKDWHDARVVS